MMKFNKIMRLKYIGLIFFVALSMTFVGCSSSDDEEEAAAAASEYVADGAEPGDLTFEKDILPLFTTAGAFVKGGKACTACHGSIANGDHEMDLSTYAGVITGADTIEKAPGASLIGTVNGTPPSAANPTDWGHSKFKGRLRNNRMPPGAWDSGDETNRDTYEITAIGAWVTAGATEDGFNAKSSTFMDGTDKTPTTANANGDLTIGELLSTKGAFVAGAAACTSCHGSIENGDHEMDISTYDNLILGADSVSKAPGVSILGQSAVGDVATYAPDWGKSKMKGRLRNNRMPPGAFDFGTETNRDTAQIKLVESWIKAGAPGTASFGCAGGVAADCVGDPAPEFTPDAVVPKASTDTADAEGTTYTFEDDVLPLLTTADAFVGGGKKCTACHGSIANGDHEMDLSSYTGVITGADTVEKAPGASLIGTDMTINAGAPDATTNPTNWGKSKFKGRLRNNRMPPGAWDDSDESNRDTFEINAIKWWLDTDGGTEDGYNTVLSAIDPAPTGTAIDDSLTVGQLFTTADAFVSGGKKCSACHGSIANGDHEMDLSTYEGIVTGADTVEKAPGVSTLGQAAAGAVTADNPVDWGSSKMKGRLRNNRMPPGGAWDHSDESNRDTVQIGLIESWIEAGALETEFSCTATQGCAGMNN